MKRFLASTAIAALSFTCSAAMAADMRVPPQNAPAKSAHAIAAPAPMHKVASIKKAEPTTDNKAKHVAAIERPVQRSRHLRLAASWREQQRQGTEMTNALNVLEAKGDTQIGDLHAKGDDIFATVTKNGKSEQLEITPNGQVEPAGI